MRTARFQCDVKRRAAWRVAVILRVAEGFDFCVWPAGAPVPAAADDFAAFHQHCADQRIWRSRAVAAPGKAKGEAHEWVGGHRAYRSRCWRSAQIYKISRLLLGGRLA